MHVIYILVFLLHVAQFQTVDIVVERDKTCSSDSQCVTIASCPFWLNKQKQLKQFEPGSQDHKALREEIVSEICNKDKKALCCPKIRSINDSPTYTPLEGECGVNPHKSPSKVFGGNDTAPGAYPFAALLGRTVLRQSNVLDRFGNRRPPVKKPSWVCGGTLINYWYVVTAAHCIGKQAQKITHLRLGEWKVGGFGSGEGNSDELPPVQQFQISQNDIIVHQGYRRKRRNIENDIALIRLPRKAELNLGVQFACLPLPERARSVGARNWNSGLDGKRATVVGWGYSCYKNNSRSFCEDDDVPTKKQQYLEVPVEKESTCSSKGFALTENQVCAGGEPGKGSCRGDSGGGLFTRKEGENAKEEEPWYLFGIVSYGKPTCGLAVPEVYTRVSKYVRWIQDNMGK